MSQRVIGSILQGAYGDYYEQATCLKHYLRSQPGLRLKLYAGDAHRLEELRVLDFSFAESFEHWGSIREDSVDDFWQFQSADGEFRADIFPHLPARAQAMIDRLPNLLPWRYLPKLMPLDEAGRINLSTEGLDRLPEVLRQSGLSEAIFQKPTVSFLWRHRRPGTAIQPWLQQPADLLAEKYSRAFSELIRRTGCHVLVFGMKVQTTEANRHRVGSKFADFGLDLPAANCTHMQGLSWGVELEIARRTTVCCGHPSGFTEALDLLRNDVLLVDPLPHYLLKLLKYRMPFFRHNTPAGFLGLWRFRSTERSLVRELERRLRSASETK
ncbi:hypothetical protein [Paludibaculum fermentans]|uniref:hypothetical protein n=1 Tax=Paludibaculum fermentans TaxID=1473598 RepID=UPI003EB9573E